MKLRNVILALALVLAPTGCTAKKDDTPKQPPSIEQLAELYKGMADENNPVHVELLAAGYRPVGAHEEYIVVETQTPTFATTVWARVADPDKPLISLSEDNKYASLRYHTQAWRCDVPASNTWGPDALTTALKKLSVGTGRERTVEVDGATQTFFCGL